MTTTTHPQWLPITPALLNDIDAGEHGSKFWLAARGMQEAIVGEYEWQEGGNPHGFNTESGERWSPSELTHVMPYTPPALPTE